MSELTAMHEWVQKALPSLSNRFESGWEAHGREL